MIRFLQLMLLVYFDLCNCGTLPADQQAEHTLITSLLKDYNKNIRPASQVSVDITASLQQIVSLDDKQQIMTSSSFISQIWLDERLSWMPDSSNNDTEVVMLPVKSLWIPDTMILNSADPNAYLTISDYSLASVYYTGHVYMILPALTIRTRCSLYAQKFPFDKQICSIDLTSWAQGYNRIAYTENDSVVIDLSGYIEHPLWELMKTDIVVIKAEDRAPFEYTYNTIISIQLYLQRKPLFFILNGIFACLILNCVTLISFTLSFATQISLCMICFMTYSVYSLNFSNLFPQQSEYLMMITLYFLLSIVWTLISMIWFVICNYYTTKGEMPKLLYRFAGMLQKGCHYCFPTSKIENTNKDINVENGQVVASRGNRLTVESIEKEQDISVENKESVKKTLPDIKPIGTNEKKKFKCNFCNRCESCQGDVEKEKTKTKNKKDIEARCNALNYFVLLFVFVIMLISNLILWLSMAN